MSLTLLKQTRLSGFTLMELMIVIAIIGILVAIAIPSYKVYTRRAHYTEVVQAAAPFKIAVEECFQVTNSLADCSAGIHGIPPSVTQGTGSGLVDSLNVNNGIISIIPKEKFGITSNDTYNLNPKEDNGTLTWDASGGGVSQGYAR